MGPDISATSYSQPIGACSLLLSRCSVSSKPFAVNSSSLCLLNFHVIHLKLYLPSLLSRGNGPGSSCCQSHALVLSFFIHAHILSQCSNDEGHTQRKVKQNHLMWAPVLLGNSPFSFFALLEIPNMLKMMCCKPGHVGTEEVASKRNN